MTEHPLPAMLLRKIQTKGTATMVGSILLACSVNDSELSDKILSVCRTDLKQRTASPVS
ncbi:hypothetical protein ACFCP7_27185 [Paenibacillus elgii]